MKVDAERPARLPGRAATPCSPVTDVLDREHASTSPCSTTCSSPTATSSELGVALRAGLRGVGAGAAEQAHPGARSATRARSSRSRSRTPMTTSIRSYAFIWVPGYDDALPQLDRTAPALEVEQRAARCASTSTTTSSRSAATRCASPTRARCGRRTPTATDLVVDDAHPGVHLGRPVLRAGVDLVRGDRRHARPPIRTGTRAILTLPIDVQPRDNQPPAFNGGAVDFEPGQEKELDLVRLTNYPYPTTSTSSSTRCCNPLPDGFSYELDGQRLVLTANETAVDRQRHLDLASACATPSTTGRAGTHRSCRSCPRRGRSPARSPTRAVAQRGQTTTVDVLANDQANNPFPETPLRVIDDPRHRRRRAAGRGDDHPERRQVAARA